MENSQTLLDKQSAFNAAMRKFHHKAYLRIYKIVSTLNVSMQVILLVLIFQIDLPLIWSISLFVLAYAFTDFLNGLVHLYMDHNDRYDSIFAPFIASFHLHHHTPKYKDKNLFVIYFNESGPKFWLLPYLLVVLFLFSQEVSPALLLFFGYVGILSSVAEVSHYLCHNSDNKLVLFLQKYNILLSKKHHLKHHKYDNQGYAFLNGMSDKLINIIAKKFYASYQNGTDLHYKNYTGVQTKNREN